MKIITCEQVSCGHPNIEHQNGAEEEQLAGSLVNLEEHIEKLLGVIGYGRDHSDRTTETVHTGCDI